MQKFLIMMKSNLFFLLLLVCLVSVITKNLLPNPRPGLLSDFHFPLPMSLHLWFTQKWMSPWTCHFLYLTTLFPSFQIQIKYHLGTFSKPIGSVIYSNTSLLQALILSLYSPWHIDLSVSSLLLRLWCFEHRNEFYFALKPMPLVNAQCLWDGWMHEWLWEATRSLVI